MAHRKAANSEGEKPQEKNDEFEDDYRNLGWRQWKTRLEIENNDTGIKQKCKKTRCLT